MSVDDFWRLTPWQLKTIAKPSREMAVTTAWMSALYERQKRLKPFSAVLDELYKTEKHSIARKNLDAMKKRRRRRKKKPEQPQEQLNGG